MKIKNVKKYLKDMKYRNNKIEYYTVDRIEENIVVLENRITLEIINTNLKSLPRKYKARDDSKKGKYYVFYRY